MASAIAGDLVSADEGTSSSLSIRVNIDIAAIAAILALGAWVAWTLRYTIMDDAYITYRYAYNLATGHGFVYNHGQWYMGTTAPLYGILIGILGIPHPAAIPGIGFVLSAASLLAAAAGLYTFGRLAGSRLAGFAAAILFVASPTAALLFGMETFTEIALVVWALVAYRVGRFNIAGALLVVAVLVRADAALALVVVAATFAITQRRVPWRTLALMAGIGVPFTVLSFIFYGSFVPGTLDSKLAQSASGVWPPFGAGLARYFHGTDPSTYLIMGRPWGAPLLVLALIGVGGLWWYRRFVPLVAWGTLHVVAYTLLHPAFYYWYAAPLVVAYVALVGIGGATCARCVAWTAPRIARRLPDRWARHIDARSWRYVLAGAICVGLLPVVHARGDYSAAIAYKNAAAAYPGYRAAGEWLRTNTAENATVGYREIGYLGYVADRTIIDGLGLVNPGVAPHVAKRELGWAYETYRPDFILTEPTNPCSCEDATWFRQGYRQATVIQVKGAQPLTIYRRQDATRDASQDTADLPTLPGATDFHLETINGAGAGGAVTLRTGTPLSLAGWAIDTSAKASAGGVRVSMGDGSTIWADYGLARPDVARAMGIASDRDGFTLALPTDRYAPGTYHLTFAVLSNDGRGYYAVPVQLTVQITA